MKYKLILVNGKIVTYRYFGAFYNRLVKEVGIIEALEIIREWL